MTMQYDVKGSKLAGSGFLVSGRVRLKQYAFLGNGTAGGVELFDCDTAPTSVTYARSGNTITVTHNAHGYSAGQSIGLSFSAASGSSGTNGNYVIQTVATNTYTVTDINSGTIAGGTAAVEGQRWLIGSSTSTGVQPFQVLIPGEGILCLTGVYAVCTNVTSVSIIYG